jgi:hypothetical protein
LAALREAGAQTSSENTFIEGINEHTREAAEPPVWATLYTSLFDTTPSLHLRCATWDGFTSCMRASWQDAISGKGETAKLIPSHMDPAYSAKRDRAATCDGVPLPAGAGWADGSGVVGAVARDGDGASRRGGDNVLAARMVALDNDGGEPHRDGVRAADARHQDARGQQLLLHPAGAALARPHADRPAGNGRNLRAADPAHHAAPQGRGLLVEG